ncbi:COX15/CtaA family protein [Cyanobacterium sp. IPPAS B-1200]|uniref:COX15/CtaA family protein n=1 Tax=Cyanobacterium sp. IPPAS B-1200 TaxID=1562720 RepID=UPI00085255DE|nr:heme A synthase [Cyanobacterium sp. IPPAS B-1200]OEJ78900.1 cytochrome C oxidase subunit I [Cyanobacterium sp. IPPAS B-1200]
MTESILYTSIPRSAQPSKPIKWVLWLVWKMAIATLLLMAIGVATRVMNAGLACPDWPLCYGQVVPTKQMNLQVFLEWFHRLDASFIGLSAIALTGLSWWKKSALPRWLPWASTFALGLIVFQGILGGLTVTQLLRFDIVTAHLGTALLFFATLVFIGSKISPYQGTATVGNLKGMSIIASILVYVQCILGGLVASQWAAHQCLAGGQLCFVMNSHIIGIFPPTIATLSVIIFSWRTPALAVKLRNLAKIISLLLVSQILLGVATFYLHLQVEPLTIAHHTIGAALFGSLVSFSVFASRDSEVSYQ